MERADLAARLIAADDAERATLLQSHAALADAALAYKLKDICLDAWASDPVRATGAAHALEIFARVTTDGEVSACAAWSAGIAALVAGQWSLPSSISTQPKSVLSRSISSTLPLPHRFPSSSRSPSSGVTTKRLSAACAL